MSNENFDFVDYIVKYDRLYTSGLTFAKDAFTVDYLQQVPIVFPSHNDTALGIAYLDHLDDGIVAKCKFVDTDVGKFAKEGLIENDSFGLTFFATKIKRSDNNIQSGHIQAVVVDFKSALYTCEGGESNAGKE